MHKSTICLNMILKNEAHVIRRCLDSVAPLVDRWLIVDTGSTDGTQEIVRAHLKHLPGECIERPWKGFGHNRSEAIELAGKRSDYLLFIDADDWLEFDPDFVRPRLTADAYDVSIQHGRITYRRPCLVRSALPWRFKGVLHEYLDCAESYTRAVLDGVRMHYSGEGGRTAEAGAQKFRRDAEILERGLAEEPDNTRYMFYLAQSYRDAGEKELALAAYDRRASDPRGFDQEIYLSRLYAARLAAALGHPNASVVDRYLRAWEARPARAEAIGELTRYLRETGPRWTLGYLLGQRAIALEPTGDSLFVEPDWTSWRCLDEFAIAAYWTGNYRECMSACEKLLAGTALPLEQRERVLGNLNHARGKLGLAQAAA